MAAPNILSATSIYGKQTGAALDTTTTTSLLANTASSNKLLKILEDPPKNTYFILTSNSENSILPTVRSRCQITKITKGSSLKSNEQLMLNNAYLASKIASSRISVEFINEI